MQAAINEFETKVLNIDPNEIANKLRELGALETPEFLARRRVFDIGLGKHEFIRLREGDGKTTMTFKRKSETKTEIGRTIEIEVEVSDFKKASEILGKAPFEKVLYQENKMHVFKIDNIEFTIATWPKIKPYLEVESDSLENVQKGLELLGLLGKDVGDLDVQSIYREIGIALNDILELKF